MKKPILLALSLASLLGAQAQYVINAPQQQPLQQSRAESTYTIQFCGQLARWAYLADAPEQYQLVQYIYVTPEMATQLAGNKITSIGYAPCLGAGQTPGITVKGTVFVKEDLDADPVVSMNVNIEDSYTRPTGYYQEGSFVRSKQYEIKPGVGFYFGYTMPCTSADFPLALDGMAITSGAGAIQMFSTEGELLYQADVAEFEENNLILYARTRGESAGLDKVFTIGDVIYEGPELPIFDAAHQFNPRVYINNMGSDPVTTVEYEYVYSDGSHGSAAAHIEVPGHEKGYYEFAVEPYPVGRGSATITVVSVDGHDAGSVFASTDFINLGQAEGFTRQFVVEEGTGTWCQYCPLGIAGLEWMEEKYPDTFLPIGIHYQDAFAVMAYNPLISKFFVGFPMAVVNRDPGYVFSPYYQTLDEIYAEWSAFTSHAQLSVEGTANDKNINLTANVKFAIDDPSAIYSVVFVVCEDGLEGVQTNGFSGSTDASLDYLGWDKYPTYVPWEYKHTARAISDCFGEDDNIIFSPEAGKEYSASFTFPAKCVSVDKETGAYNFGNAYAVALLLETETGAIVNAAKVRLGSAPDGIESLGADQAPAAYYDLQGVKVLSPVKGRTYIRVAGGNASKVVF